MIRKIQEIEKEQIIDILKEDFYQNPYLYVDLILYGASGEHVSTWIVEERNEVKVVLYQYYNSFQIYKTNTDNIDYNEIINFFRKQNTEMISGNQDIIEKIAEGLPNYKITTGFILEQPIIDRNFSEKILYAQKDDMHEVAQLICSNSEIGGHYQIDELQNQLMERLESKGCRNIIIKESNEIIGHYATYVEYEDFAVMGGLIVKEDFRKQGLGMQLHLFLTSELNKEGKKALLYCYIPEVIKLYMSVGAKVVCNCGKLEKNKI